MSNSSLARRLDSGAFTPEAGTTAGQGEVSIATSSTSGSAELPIPNFGVPNQAFAATARLAGRINASGVTQQEIKELLQERQKLLDKKFANTMSRKDENRLALVRWSLDRVEDAKFGMSLDALEEQIRHFEKLADDMKMFERNLHKASRGSR